MLSFLKKIFKSKKSEPSLVAETKKDEDDYSENEYSFEEIIASWKRGNVELNDSASFELLLSIQNQINFIFPSDFTNFYLRFNGFKDWDVIGNMFSIWPLERIVEEYNNDINKDFIPFCDFLINSHFIGYIKGKSAVFKDYDKSNPIAESFEETIKLIIKDSSSLY